MQTFKVRRKALVVMIGFALLMPTCRMSARAQDAPEIVRDYELCGTTPCSFEPPTSPVPTPEVTPEPPRKVWLPVVFKS